MLDEWCDIVNAIIDTRKYCDYKGGWTLYKLQEYGVPEKIWEYTCDVINQDLSWWSKLLMGLNVDEAPLTTSKKDKIIKDMQKEKVKIDKRMGKTREQWRAKLDDVFF